MSRPDLRRNIFLFVAWCALIAGLVLGIPSAHGASGPRKLKTYSTRFYTLRTDLDKADAQLIGRHMDAVFLEYERRFRSFRPRKHKRFALYLLRTQEGYQDTLAEFGVNGQGTAGMFFVRRGGVQGLAAWVEGQSRSHLYEVLQHEGFHQFAYVYIGTDLPIWANEGLAEYFGHGILVKGRMLLGQANELRVEFIKRAIRDERTVAFEELLEMTPTEWAQAARADPEEAALLYLQSWSMVFFLVHGQNGKYLRAFERYLSALSDGRGSRKAFEKTFGSGATGPFEKRWKEFAGQAKPDALNTTLARMGFLGGGIRFLYERHGVTPATIDQLRQRLQANGFKLTQQQHGLTRELSAADSKVYEVMKPGGGRGRFRLLAPSKPDLPPSLTAPGVKPQPTLTWSRDGSGRLTDEIEFR